MINWRLHVTNYFTTICQDMSFLACTCIIIVIEKEYFDWIRKQKKRIFLTSRYSRCFNLCLSLAKWLFCFGLKINSITFANERCKSSVHFIKFLKSSHWLSLVIVVNSSHWFGYHVLSLVFMSIMASRHNKLSHLM